MEDERFDLSKTYAYDSGHGTKEHVLTGRHAHKTRRSGKVDLLVEIRPLEAPTGDKKYNLWVKLDNLYVIEDEHEDDDYEE
mgnify:CR=1 FL=1